MNKNYLYFVFILLIASVNLQAQNDYAYFWKAGNVIAQKSIKPVDLDSITFKRSSFVTICSQVWSTSNLNVTTYTDGTVLPQVTDLTTWANMTTGAWCYYNFDSANGAIYGKLYNWYAVAGIYNAASLTNPSLRKKLAPIGWHIPSDAEWTTLTDCLGGESVAGGKMKETGSAHWKIGNIASNSSDFRGLPGGNLYLNNGISVNFGGIKIYGNWWSSTEYDATNSKLRALQYSLVKVTSGSLNKIYGLSVRCLKD